MTQADSVLSTPPTNTPIDTTRRRFLAVAAFASAAGAGSLAAAAMASNDAPLAVTVPRTAGRIRRLR
jgi:nitrous oxide reductase